MNASKKRFWRSPNRAAHGSPVPWRSSCASATILTFFAHTQEFRAMRLRCLPAALAPLLLSSPLLAQSLPRVMDDRLVIELVTKEPDIVTPTGIAVDERGRIWCIENNTHQREPSYKGHPSDRIRIYDDFDEKGRARRVKTFADGFKNSMGLALH